MTRRPSFIIGSTLVLIAAMLLISSNSSKPSLNNKNKYLIHPTRRDFQVTVRAVGVLEAAKSHMISSQLKGSEAKIIQLIADGRQVKEGDVLIRFDPVPLETEIEKLKANVKSYKAAVQAARELFEWKKTEVEQQITTAEFTLTTAKLDLERLSKGDAPLKLLELQEEKEKISLEVNKYKGYVADLLDLQEEGFNNPGELSRAKEKLALHEQRYNGAVRRHENYADYVLPSMLENGKAKMEQAELNLQQIKQAGVHKIANSHASLQQIQGKSTAAQTSLKQAQLELSKTVIIAPLDGLVIHYETYRNGQLRKPREGDTVIMNQPILYLPDISAMVVNSKVREIDLHKIDIDQPALLKVEAYPDITFHGRLSFIGALAARRDNSPGGEKFFQVTFTMEDSDSRLRPGMTALATILSAEVKNQLTVPIQAVFHEGDLTFCFRRVLHGYEKKEVLTGKQNEHYIVISKGISQDDPISLIRPEGY